MATYNITFSADATFVVDVEADTGEDAADKVENWSEDVQWGKVTLTDIIGPCVVIEDPEERR